MALCMPASELWPRLKIVSVTIYPVTVLGVYYWASSALCRNGYSDRGTLTCALRKSPPSNIWLVNPSHSEGVICLRHIKKEEMTPDCPATMPRGPGTAPLSRACFPAVHHRSRPTRGLFTTQQYSAKQLHQSQPLQFAVHFRPLSRSSSGISKPAPNRPYATARASKKAVGILVMLRLFKTTQ